VWIKSLHKGNVFFYSVVFFVFALSVTTVIAVCDCGQIDLRLRQFKGL